MESGFPCGSACKESACNVGDLGSIPGLGRSPGEGKGYPLQYSGLENRMDCVVHGVAESDTTGGLFLFVCYCKAAAIQSHLQAPIIIMLLLLFHHVCSFERLLSKYYCSLTMQLVTQEVWWRYIMILILFSCQLTQHPFCSPWIISNFEFQI